MPERAEGTTQLKYIVPCLAAAAVILAGCGGGGGNGNGGDGGTAGSGGTSGSTLSASVLEANGLTATLAEDRNVIAAGGTVSYTLTLANKSTAPVTINISAGVPALPSASLVVRNSAGSAVFQPVPGAPPLNSLSLAPGQSLSTVQTVSAFAAVGTYNATATFSDTAVTNVGPLAVTVQ